jgi:hypothetical protein
MTTITFYEDYEYIRGGYLDRGQHLIDQAAVFRNLNETVIPQEQLADSLMIRTVSHLYYLSVRGMKIILADSYRRNINVNNVGDQLSLKTARRHKIAMMRFFSELNATRRKLRPLILQCAENPKVKGYLERLEQGTLKSYRVLLLSHCLDHISSVTWPSEYDVSIPDAMGNTEIVDMYDKLLGVNCGKQIPEDISNMLDLWETILEEGEAVPSFCTAEPQISV